MQNRYLMNTHSDYNCNNSNPKNIVGNIEYNCMTYITDMMTALPENKFLITTYINAAVKFWKYLHRDKK